MIIKLYRYDSEKEAEPHYSPVPETNGNDDGGRDYVLPPHYKWENGEIRSENSRCDLAVHNGRPLLVDNTRQLAFLLEQEKKITQRRKQAGLTMQELADRAGITQYVLYQLENHEIEPKTAILLKLAKALQCEIMD